MGFSRQEHWSGLHCLLQFPFPSPYMVLLFLVFWENFILFSRVAAPIYIPNSAQEFPFLHILTNTCYLLFFFDNGCWHAERCEVIFYCDFDLPFPWWFVMLLSACWQSFCLLCKNDYSGSLSIFNQVVCFLMLSCMNSLHILNINPLTDKSFANISPHSVGCCFVCSFLSYAKCLWLGVITFVYFLFLLPEETYPKRYY